MSYPTSYCTCIRHTHNRFLAAMKDKVWPTKKTTVVLLIILPTLVVGYPWILASMVELAFIFLSFVAIIFFVTIMTALAIA